MHHQPGSRSPQGIGIGIGGGGGGARRGGETNSDGATSPNQPLSLFPTKPLGRRRNRRGDTALAILGTSILILSVLHIALHSGNVPHLNHPIRSMTAPDNASVSGAQSGGGKVISPLHAKLSEFVSTGKDKKVDNLMREDRANEINELKPQIDKNKITAAVSSVPPKSIENSPPLSKKNDNNPQQIERRSKTEPSKSTTEAAIPPEKNESKPNLDSKTIVNSSQLDQPKSEAPLSPKKDESKPNLESKTIVNTSQSDQPKSEAPVLPQREESKKPNIDSKNDNTPIRNPLNNADVPHPVAHLNCDDHGGPKNKQIIDEMVFWSDIPSDASYISPMHPLNDPNTPDDTERYLTFEPDHGGWNNIRMAMETALVMSHAMGRTLVLPPEQRMYLIDKSHSNGQRSEFGFNDFFHLDAISIEHKGFKVITMEEFLTRVAMKGELHGIYPPANRTNWSGNSEGLWSYLRNVGYTPEWDPWDCALAIPASTDQQSVVDLNSTLQSIMDGSYGKPKPTLEEFNGNPTPVNASLSERMREMLADRSHLCIYDKQLQETKLIHLKIEKDVRLLTHFYAFIFFADWRQDLWSKRFVRDHLRYVDEIMCAAARVIEAVRDHAKKSGLHRNISREYDIDGAYDGMHVRRGDFQYPPTQLPAERLHELSPMLTKGATLYAATDERNKTFFDVFRKDYDLVFLDDFLHVIPDVNTNYYGMIDQLVSYKSRVFYGTWWSTLSGYVNRMRGYYITKHKLDGYKDGTMESYYFTPSERVMEMKTQYIPVRFPIYCREFPTSWRDIDCGIEELYNAVNEED